jgi:hypothetical protein
LVAARHRNGEQGVARAQAVARRDVGRPRNEAAFVIADLTDQNPNVYYELGLASIGRMAAPHRLRDLRGVCEVADAHRNDLHAADRDTLGHSSARACGSAPGAALTIATRKGIMMIMSREIPNHAHHS